MDKKRLSTSTTANRSSALPRPASRLPQPRALVIPAPTSNSLTVRPAASAEGLRGRFAQPNHSHDSKILDTANTSRLGNTPSREQHPATKSAISSPLRNPARSTAPPVSSQTAPRAGRSRSTSREPSIERGAYDAQGRQLRRQLVPRKHPSTQFVSPALHNESAIDEEGPEDELPPLMKPTEEGLTFDTLGVRPGTRKPRPSLSERTIETLSQLPSSPAVRRRTSVIFDKEPSSRRPSSRAAGGSSRPGSSHQPEGSTTRSLSRPGSSSGPREASYGTLRASTNGPKPPLSTVQGTPPSRRTSGIMKILPFKPASSAARQAPDPPLSAVGNRTPSPEKTSAVSVAKLGSRSMAVRQLKPKASMNGLVKKPSLSTVDKAVSNSYDLAMRHPRQVSLAAVQSSATPTTAAPAEERNHSSASTVSTTFTVDSPGMISPSAAARTSSTALREQIAKARAAKRAAAGSTSTGAVPSPLKSPLIPTDTTFDFGLAQDPFNQNHFESSNRKAMQSRIEMARTTGRLNIAAMGLKQIPDEVIKMYDLESVGNGGSWAESVDLTRFVAADNELETLDDDIFPDADPMDFADDEDSRGHQFGGLETLDLHGNTLIALPLGLRRLQQLTSLNLTSNKLANGCLEVISQILPLRDLKLGGNLLYGKMDSCFTLLKNLEILDLKGNEIVALPDGFERLTRLRVLNINENAFESLPFGTFAKLPLTELLAHKNRLAGTLIDVEVETLPHLRTLDVSSNQLSLIAQGPISMPSLAQLTVSINRLKSLPDIGSWKSLLTLNASENSITSIPDGLIALESLRSADFTSNDIRLVPPEIARMDSLALLRLAGNPLKDKKFTSMTTEQLKDNLAARLEPLPEDRNRVEQFGNGYEPAGGRSFPNSQLPSRSQDPMLDQDENEGNQSDNDNFATPPTSAPQSPARTKSQFIGDQTWPIKPGGILDRANTESSSLHPVVCSKLIVDHTVREIQLQHNTFTTFPNSLSFFGNTLTSLNLSHNQLVGETYLTESLHLAALKELSLSHNRITSLTPLVAHLNAPELQKLDISFNRIVSLPVLRDAFPSLAVLFVSSNHLEDLDATWVAGLKIVVADNNDIAHLNPRLGLHKFERLDVTGNRFRVPRWNVLELGTEATLRWLRGRVPVAEMDEWKAKSGNADNNDESEFD